jgi:hypothetical protein
MYKSIILGLLFLALGCSTLDKKVRIAQVISQDVQWEWRKRKDVDCIDYTEEILERCEKQGITLKQASFSRDYHRALLYVEGEGIDGNTLVIDSTGAMAFRPVKLSELKRITGFRLYNLNLIKGESFVMEK